MTLRTRVGKLERSQPAQPPTLTQEERRQRIESVLAREPDSARSRRIVELLTVAERRRAVGELPGGSE